jgi:hypothetical protein
VTLNISARLASSGLDLTRNFQICRLQVNRRTRIRGSRRVCSTLRTKPKLAMDGMLCDERNKFWQCVLSIGRRVRACTRLSEPAKALTTRDYVRGISGPSTLLNTLA